LLEVLEERNGPSGLRDDDDDDYLRNDKATDVQCVRTFIGSIGTKAHQNISAKVSGYI